MARKAKVIVNQEDINYIVNITEDDITTSFIMDTFGKFGDKQRFNTYDIITIPPGKYGNKNKLNKNSFTTTVGIYIFNKYFIERDLFDLFGYINEEINSGKIKEINKTISYALLEDKCTVDDVKRFQQKLQKFMPYVTVIAPSFTDKFLTSTDAINKKKNELLKKYEKEIAEGNPVICEKIEKELIEFAKEYLADDEGLDQYISGARASLGNQFKNMYIMKGAVRDPDPNAKQKYKVITSSFMDGVKPEEYSTLSNSLATGPYSRSKKTEVGGALEKQFLYAYQHIKLDPEGSDCKTKRYLKIKLTKKNISEWMYCYIIQGNNLVEITSENKDKFIDKEVKIRFSALCESKTGICNKCFGNLPYRRGDLNVGISTTNIPSKMKNISMKAFHDSVQKTTVIDVNKAFGITK